MRLKIPPRMSCVTISNNYNETKRNTKSPSHQLQDRNAQDKPTNYTEKEKKKKKKHKEGGKKR